ncbi:hypothetical protein LEMLEM_LOCUS16794, partial [Lemmus lemmus]
MAGKLKSVLLSFMTRVTRGLSPDSLLHFLSEEGRPPKEINQMWHNKLQCTSLHIKTVRSSWAVVVHVFTHL